MIKELKISSKKHNEFIDITDEVHAVVSQSKIGSGICTVFTPHATGAITINENADPNVPIDIISVLDKIVPQERNYLHDQIDGNAVSHIKSSLIGSSQSIPIINSKLALGAWQNIFFCEFDGPRGMRRIIVTLTRSEN